MKQVTNICTIRLQLQRSFLQPLAFHALFGRFWWSNVFLTFDQPWLQFSSHSFVAGGGREKKDPFIRWRPDCSCVFSSCSVYGWLLLLRMLVSSTFALVSGSQFTAFTTVTCADMCGAAFVTFKDQKQSIMAACHKFRLTFLQWLYIRKKLWLPPHQAIRVSLTMLINTCIDAIHGFF